MLRMNRRGLKFKHLERLHIQASYFIHLPGAKGLLFLSYKEVNVYIQSGGGDVGSGRRRRKVHFGF